MVEARYAPVYYQGETGRKVMTPIPGPKSAQVLKRQQEAVANAITPLLPVVAERSYAEFLEDIDGNTFLDLGSGISVTSVGNDCRPVLDAVHAQLKKFIHLTSAITAHEAYAALAERLNHLTPGNFAKKSAFFTSGAEGIENAVKLARAFTGKNGIASLDHGYHGRTNLTMALTSKQRPYKRGFGPFASDIYQIPNSYPYRDGIDDGQEVAARTIEYLKRKVAIDDLAAILFEPIQGESGFIVPAAGFLKALSEWADQEGILIIADEIQTGFGRTGTFFASEFEGIVPDLLVTAKTLAAGFPLSGVTGRAEILDSAAPGAIGGTYAANPLGCVAALAVIDFIEHENLVSRAQEIEAILLGRLGGVKHPHIAEVRGRGAMIAIEFVVPGTTEPDPIFAKKILTALHERGVLALSAGTYDNVIRMLPPLVIRDESLHDALDVFDEVLNNSAVL